MKIIFPNVVGTIDIYMDCLRAICGNTEGKSMVDIGCCFAPNTPNLGFDQRLYVDVVDRVLDHANEQPFFQKFDILTINDFAIKKDVALALDVIEHLLLPDGRKLIDIMQRMSRRQVVFTPLTDLFGMAQPDNNDPEAHRSLWSPDDFPGWGTLVFPDYHRIWNGGAFFTWRTENMEEDYARVWQYLCQKPWLKGIKTQFE